MSKLDLSVVVIAKDEASTLPRLLESLKGVSDIVVLDTGSTDDTVTVAQVHGCNVISVGNRFKEKATEEQYAQFVARFEHEPAFEVGKGYFHFANARNYATQFAKNDFCFHFDSDEWVEWDLDKVREAIQTEDGLRYRFCYAHKQGDFDNPDWRCGLQFEHSKGFRKSKSEWVGGVHEIHRGVLGKKPKPFRYVPFIYLHHWQNPSTNRGNYLPGLELAVVEEPDNPRQVYYLARELFYAGK